MNPPTSPNSGRCGMCGSCGTMPPWAPERLKNTSPEARLALERRMREAQKRFIEQRDAKRALEANAPEHGSTPEHHEPLQTPLSQPENEVETNPTSHHDLPNTHSPAHKDDFVHGITQHERNVSQLETENFCEQPDTQLPRDTIRNDVTPEPPLDIEQPENETLMHTTQPEHGGDMDDDLNIEIPLQPSETPSQSPNNNSSHENSQANHAFEASQVPQPSRRKQPRFGSPVILESPASPDATELEMVPEISLELDELSEPLRTISLRDADSDADSFHTAEEEEALRRSADYLPLKDEEGSEEDIVPVVSEVEWQAFQQEDERAEPEIASKVSAGSVSAVSSTDEDASLEGFTKDMSNSVRPAPQLEDISSQPDDNLESSTATTGLSPKATRDALVDDYALPADLVQSRKTNAESKPCEDCERWRERVRELEFKVEALTSALTAREMESASMRARVADRRYTGKNATQLMEECESLRMTTEYLYHKLERYERKLNGSHPVVH